MAPEDIQKQLAELKKQSELSVDNDGTEPHIGIAGALGANLKFVEGMLRPSSSPSGYDIYRDGQWIPYTPHFLRKKLKKKLTRQEKVKKEQEAVAKEYADKAKKEREDAEKLHEQMMSVLRAFPNVVILEDVCGYALIAYRTLLNIQTLIEKGAAFQPYESINKEHFTLLSLMQWGRDRLTYGDILRKFTGMSIPHEIFTSPQDLKLFLVNNVNCKS